MRREEAIETIRRCCPKVGDSQCYFESALRELVPELAESEDERIRKWILEKVQGYADSGIPSTDEIQMANNAIAYLEKQKEQKPKLDEVGKLEFCKKCSRSIFQYQRGYDQGLIDGQIKTEKEQKPAEWSKNDTVFLNEITDFFENKTVKLQHDIDMYAHWLKSLPERFSLQPKQEWSEDTIDEFTWNIRNLITDKLTVHTKGLDGSELSSTVFIDDKTAKDIASGILFYVGKEAMKNPNREIPEWSEEDEAFLKTAIAICNRYSHKDIADWLKSLRPPQYCEDCKLKKSVQGWKPSEEQMGALNYAYCELFKREDVGHNILGPLQSLIDNLNKLM